VPAPKTKVFKAWTDPEQLKRWWSIADGWSTTFAEVDLKVGGRFALGNKPPGGELVLVTGEYLLVSPPDKLVYTWRFSGPKPEESVVTVEFNGLGETTEVVVTHEQSSPDMGPSALAGWGIVLQSLNAFVS